TAEVADLGLEEYLYNKGVCVIEWAERGVGVLPQEHLLIKLDYVPDYETHRVIRFKPEGQRYSELVQGLKSLLAKEQQWS
ncbi:MAG: tRNA (adenosine(37)-N6)-threonylcarbamoyltransferase complex ATPase subunit type 1 TsaE, partial [Chloroflexota bacterium]|nr:tRNA (adenosine(37)-N6)-threonylcarbamoyltransferase complex ATPase subunit type 1 TsaE [Chloroflexota bacterium]